MPRIQSDVGVTTTTIASSDLPASNSSSVSFSVTELCARFVVKRRTPLLLVALLLALAAWPFAGSLKMDRQLERMVVADDPALIGYQELKERFGGNEVVLFVYRDEQLWNPNGEGLERLKKVSADLRAVPGVQAILSLAELDDVLRTLGSGPFVTKSAAPGVLAADDPLAKSFRELFDGYTHRVDQPYLAAACLLEPLEQTTASREETIDAIRSVAQKMPASFEAQITGEPVMVVDGFRLVEYDGAMLGITASLALAVVLVILFRSIRWTLLPLVLVQWTLLVTRGLLVVLGGELSMVSSMLTAIVTVIGVATVIHIVLEYQTQLESEKSQPEQAMQRTIARLWSPIAWSCLTTAGGFGALMLARVGPVRDFGWIMALAVLVVWLGTMIVVPGIALIGSWDRKPVHVPLDRWLQKKAVALLDICLKWCVAILVLVGVVTALSLWGSSRLQVETDFTRSFKESNPLVQAYSTVEEHLGGAGVWDVLLPAPALLGEGYLADVRLLEQRLRDLRVSEDSEVRLTKVLSLADADEAAKSNRMLALLPAAARLEGMRQVMPEFTAAMVTELPIPTINSKTDIASAGDATQQSNPPRWLRVMLRSAERTAANDKIQLIKAVEDTVKEFSKRSEWQSHFAIAPPAPRVTGYYILLARLVESLLNDQWFCFAIATLVVLVMVVVAHRSLWAALASMVPNLLPILIVWGVMGFIGLHVDMGAVMIAAVSVGLSIDGSIHYLHRARLREGTKLSSKYDLHEAQRSTGLALFIATIALIVGFVSLTRSDFRPTVTFGILVSLTMLGGLIGNLLLLPLLLPASSRENSP